MRIICEKADIVSALNVALKAVPSRTTMPILECVLVEAGNDIRITSNDTEVGIETLLDGKIEEPGTIAIDAKIIRDIVAKCPNDWIKIVTDESLTAQITCGKAKFQIPCKDGETFLKIPDVNEEQYIEIPECNLKSIIAKTLFCASAVDNNRLMMGELFEVSGNKLKLTALDGHRIAIKETILSKSYPDAKAVVPGKTLSEIMKILSGRNDVVKMYISKNHIRFDIGNSKITSILIDGEFFAIDRLLKTDHTIKVTANISDLLNGINRATVLIRDGDKKPVVCNFTGNVLGISATSSMGSVHEEIDIDHYGDDLRIGFNPRFIIDALAAIDEDTVTMEMSNAKSPCFLRNEELGYTYIVLPVNLHGA